MPTKTPEKTTTEVPEGFEKIGKSNLPPFFDLAQEGQTLRGLIKDIRIQKLVEKIRTKQGMQEVDRQKYYFDIELTEEAKGDDASKEHRPVTHQKGELVTLSGSGNLVRSFTLAAMKKSGQDETDYPTDGTEPKIEWEVLKNLEVFIRREADGKMGKKSKFPGNKVKQYTVAFAHLSQPLRVE